jgi:hypothetical protein
MDPDSLRATLGASGAGRTQQDSVGVWEISYSELGEVENFIGSIDIYEMSHRTSSSARSALITQFECLPGNILEQLVLEFRVNTMIRCSRRHLGYRLSVTFNTP